MSLIENTGPLFESILPDNTEDCELVVTPTLFAWTEKRTVFGFDRTVFDSQNATLGSPTGQFSLRNVYDNMAPAYLVKVGDFRQGYGGASGAAGLAAGDPAATAALYANCAVAVQVSLRQRSDRDAVNVDQVIRYMQPGPNCEVSYDVYQQTEIRNFAEDPTGWGPNGPITSPGQADTKVTAILYKAQGQMGQAQGAYSNSDVPYVMDVPVPCVIRSVRVTQYEVIPKVTPGLMQAHERPIWNETDCFGYKAGSLLFLGVSSQTDGTDLYRRTYTFLINQYGWHHFYGVYQMADGFVPYIIQPLDPKMVNPLAGTYNSLVALPGSDPLPNNGVGAFRMLPHADLAKLLPQLKPPFGGPTYAAPVALPPGYVPITPTSAPQETISSGGAPAAQPGSFA